MSCDIKRDEAGQIMAFQCGPEPKPVDHTCDAKGPMKELDTGMGEVVSATCSVCGRPAFNMRDIW